MTYIYWIDGYLFVNITDVITFLKKIAGHIQQKIIISLTLSVPTRVLPTNCLSVFDHFVGLVPKGLSSVNDQFQEENTLNPINLLQLHMVKVNNKDMRSQLTDIRPVLHTYMRLKPATLINWTLLHGCS